MSPCDPIDRIPPPAALLGLAAALASAEADAEAAAWVAGGLVGVLADADAAAELGGATEGLALVHDPTTIARHVMATTHHGPRRTVPSIAGPSSERRR